MSDKVKVWSTVLSKIIAPETHGNKKEPAMPWQEYFENLLGEQLEDVPLIFQSSDFPCESAVLHVSTHISLTTKEKEAAERRLECTRQRLAKSKRAFEASEKRAISKATKLIELVESGKQAEIMERKRWMVEK